MTAAWRYEALRYAKGTLFVWTIELPIIRSAQICYPDGCCPSRPQKRYLLDCLALSIDGEALAATTSETAMDEALKTLRQRLALALESLPQ
jgi:hypothetical protein